MSEIYDDLNSSLCKDPRDSRHDDDGQAYSCRQGPVALAVLNVLEDDARTDDISV